MAKTITIYTKSAGCQQCEMTKRRLLATGIATKDVDGNLTSAIDGITLTIHEVDLPENRHIAEELAYSGITSVPAVQLDFQLEPEDAPACDSWQGFRPDLIGALANQLTEE